MAASKPEIPTSQLTGETYTKLNFSLPVKSGSISVRMAVVKNWGKTLKFLFYLIGKLRYTTGLVCVLNMSGHMRVNLLYCFMQIGEVVGASSDKIEALMNANN